MLFGAPRVFVLERIRVSFRLEAGTGVDRGKEERKERKGTERRWN